MKMASKLVPQHRVAVRRHRDAGLQVVVGAPRQRLEIELPPEHLADRAHRLDRFRGRLDADAVAGNDCYAHWVIW